MILKMIFKISFYFFLMAFLNHCSNTKTTKNTAMSFEGAWVKFKKCQDTPEKNLKKTTAIFIKKIEEKSNFFNLFEQTIFYSDSLCQVKTMTIFSDSNIRIQGPQTNSQYTPNPFNFTVDRSKIFAIIHTNDMLLQANLQTQKGLQKQNNKRFCQRKSDWVLEQKIDISNQICGLKIQTQTFENGKNLLYVNSKGDILKFGILDLNNSRFPHSLLEDKEDSWFKVK